MNNRRSFLKKSAITVSGAFAIPSIIPASAMGRDGFVPPSDRITMGIIGAGNQAGNDVGNFLRDERVQITTICDVNKKSSGYWNGKVAGREFIMDMVDSTYSERAGKTYTSTVGVTDFREVIEDKKIDAVEIVTPDHWHSIPALMAAAAKKDIYCQKPLALTIEEGRAISNAAKKYGIVFQVGSQQRSNPYFRGAVEKVRSGKLGKLIKVTCGLPAGTPDYGKTGDQTDTVPVPKDFDYNMWLGPAPDAPYCPARTHVNFRWILDYSGGQITDWGGHHPDIAQWGINKEESGPIKIQNAKATWADHPIWNTATEYYFEAVYDNDVLLVIGNVDEEKGIKSGVTFYCEEGWIQANRHMHAANPESLLRMEVEEKDKLYTSNDHYRNFIDCVISKERTAAPAEFGHRSITIGHLGNISMMLNQDLEWDPVTERVTNSWVANQLLSRKMRAPWDKVYKEYLV
ncbi:MAG: Gfo/Idh/MocA family protein [Bacteroidota bacterium]